MWEILLLTFLIILGFGAAIVMARKTKPTTIVVQNQSIDLEELATKVAIAVVKAMGKFPQITTPQQLFNVESDDVDIDMDKIIPVAINTAVTEANIDSAVKEEKTVDKGLKKSKSKLADILKRKKE